MFTLNIIFFNYFSEQNKRKKWLCVKEIIPLDLRWNMLLLAIERQSKVKAGTTLLDYLLVRLFIQDMGNRSQHCFGMSKQLSASWSQKCNFGVPLLSLLKTAQFQKANLIIIIVCFSRSNFITQKQRHWIFGIFYLSDRGEGTFLV